MSTRSKAALVTGVSEGGTGFATALALAQAGWATYAGTRHPEAVAHLSVSGAHVVPLDVTDEEQMQAVVERIESAHGFVATLVNNAAYGEMGPIETVPLNQVRRQFETNVFGAVRLCQHVMPGMRRAGFGRIINVSSMGGEFTTPFSGYYHASKYAIESISDALRMEAQPFGIDVVVIQPGGINTPLALKTADSIPTPMDDPYLDRLRIFRKTSEAMMTMLDQIAATPEQVAQVILNAITTEKPYTRYKVTVQPMEEVNAARNESDRAKDAALLQQLGLANI